jgi:hypothetical protein
MPSIIYSWNKVAEKNIEADMELVFVELLGKPNKVNPYKAKVKHVDTRGDTVSMKLQVIKPDRNKRYQQNDQITRHWPKNDGNSGTTLIYTSYEIGTNNYPDSPIVQFMEPEQI